MKILSLTAVILVLLSGSAIAATPDGTRNPDAMTATLDVMKETVAGEEPGIYSFHHDGNDIVLRKRPGRTKYSDITLKKGLRCGVNDCDDDDRPAHPEAARMNKSELIEAIASRSGLSKADAKRALEGFIDSSTKALKKGDTVMLVGTGSFYAQCPMDAREKAKKTSCRSSHYLDPDDDGDGIATVIEAPEQAYDTLKNRLEAREGNGGIDIGLKTKT